MNFSKLQTFFQWLFLHSVEGDYGIFFQDDELKYADIECENNGQIFIQISNRPAEQESSEVKNNKNSIIAAINRIREYMYK